MKHVNIHVITVKAVTKHLDVYPAVMMVTIENTTPTNKVMNVSSAVRPVHLVLRSIRVNRVEQDIGGARVRPNVQITALNVHQI